MKRDNNLVDRHVVAAVLWKSVHENGCKYDHAALSTCMKFSKNNKKKNKDNY